MEHAYIKDVFKELEIPENGTLSRTLYSDEKIKVVIFGFDTGQELSEHTASVPAIIQILQGEVDLTLGQEKTSGVAGTWVQMNAHLPHSVLARCPTIMLLTLLKS